MAEPKTIDEAARVDTRCPFCGTAVPDKEGKIGAIGEFGKRARRLRVFCDASHERAYLDAHPTEDAVEVKRVEDDEIARSRTV